MNEKHKLFVVLFVVIVVVVAIAVAIVANTDVEPENDVTFLILSVELIFIKAGMPKNTNADLWRFPDHKSWVPVKVNSGRKKCMITELKSMLNKFGLEDKFKEGPFGIYLELKEPLALYEQLIHNILKREIIHPKGQREDKMWFRIFKGKRPTAEVLYATLSKMTFEQSEDAYKMLNIYMVSQFFGNDDRQTTTICGWLFSLVENEKEFKKFPWGSYIFSFTLHFLKGVLNKRLSQLRGEAKKKEKEKGKGKGKGGEEKNKKKSN
ncbi:hypothetical protein Ddye_007832 [Dipteronia dyeriana]|uniref:DUF1985 domain-containing protein n=1 Tax=Dipteronia dyeriana TaxID=168575 RepID=A0AAE0CS21_9ROSI|nr:hypothetical protein Ddye_007832 [Dipteronia dyeriana]